jgi:hypothetical protein
MSGQGHLVEIHRSIAWPQGPRGYFASCTCGWHGTIRSTVAAAEKDGHAHQASS